MKTWINNIFQRGRHYLIRLFRGPNKSLSSTVVDSQPMADQLCSIINNAKEQAEGAQVTAGEISLSLQQVIDNADVTIPLVRYMNPAKIEETAVIWGEIVQQTGSMRGSLKTMEPLSGTIYATTSLSSADTSGMESSLVIPFHANSGYKNAWTNFIVFASRPALKDEVITLMHLFHLDVKPSGKLSPLELFETAYRAFEVPVSKEDPVITSLIPIRESINAALDELLKLRPNQEPIGINHGKIKSICAQLKRDTISDVIVQEWADQWRDIGDHELSPSKQYRMDREEWSRRLNRATLLFHSLLLGLDQSKLRK